jgi:hypothetical protein
VIQITDGLYLVNDILVIMLLLNLLIDMFFKSRLSIRSAKGTSAYKQHKNSRIGTFDEEVELTAQQDGQELLLHSVCYQIVLGRSRPLLCMAGY